MLIFLICVFGESVYDVTKEVCIYFDKNWVKVSIKDLKLLYRCYDYVLLIFCKLIITGNFSLEI